LPALTIDDWPICDQQGVHDAIVLKCRLRGAARIISELIPQLINLGRVITILELYTAIRWHRSNGELDGDISTFCVAELIRLNLKS
jgi:hypothetical protein